MKKALILLFVFVIIFGAGFLVLSKKYKSPDEDDLNSLISTENGKRHDNVSDNPLPDNHQNNTGNNQNVAVFAPPLDKASERVTKKTFGMRITPSNSPVQPERFSGYHTGTDFEIFPEEGNSDVLVRAVCSGKLKLKEHASGYGGVLIEDCEFDGRPVTVVYGHLKLSGVDLKIGEDIKVGDEIGILGEGYSQETDGERKHLHLGFHKGMAVDIRGYVQKESELSAWIDPCEYVCR